MAKGGRASKPFVIWAAERTRSLEDLIFTECAPKFAEDFSDVPERYAIFKPYYHIYLFPLDPRQFGDPISRFRMYCVMIKKGRFHIPDDFSINGLLQTMGRIPVLDADSMFRAPKEVVDKMRCRLAASLRLPGPPDTFKQVLDGSQRGRLDNFEATVQDMITSGKLRGDESIYFDLTQNADARLRMSAHKLFSLVTHFSIWIRIGSCTESWPRCMFCVSA
jgi:hypothetical protein